MGMEDWLYKGCISIIIVTLIGSCYLIYIDSQRSTFTLIKEDWQCIEHHNKIYTTLIPVGKVMVPQIHNDTICDNYRRIK